MDFSYSQQQLEIKRGIREWGKKHLTEEAIAAGYKNRGIAPEIAKAWVDDGWGMYGLPEEYGGKPVDHQTMAMIIEELNHCGGNIPMAPNLLIMFDMVEFGTPEQIQYAVDYYKENGYPPYCLAISEPEAGSANQYMTARPRPPWTTPAPGPTSVSSSARASRPSSSCRSISSRCRSSSPTPVTSCTAPAGRWTTASR